MSGERWGPPPQRRKRPAAANPGRFRIERNSNDDGAQSIPSGRVVKPFDGSAAPDGEFVLDNKGKRIFDPTVDFKDRATREKFLDLVLEALRHVRPELFQLGAGDAG